MASIHVEERNAVSGLSKQLEQVRPMHMKTPEFGLTNPICSFRHRRPMVTEISLETVQIRTSTVFERTPCEYG